LHEHLDFLVSGDYVTRKSTCPASFAIALDTVAFLKLGEICKKLKSDHAAKKAKQIKEELQKLGYSDA
jgi:hypothetical protein